MFGRADRRKHCPSKRTRQHGLCLQKFVNFLWKKRPNRDVWKNNTAPQHKCLMSTVKHGVGGVMIWGGVCSQRTWAPYSHCVDHVLFCLLPRHQAVLWCQEQGPWGWLRFAVHCYGFLGLLPFGLDAPSGAFFLLLLGLTCSCH